MESIFRALQSSVSHIRILNEVFIEEENYSDPDDFAIYKEHLDKFNEICGELEFDKQLYSEYNRQMKLADLIEYVFFSRGIFALLNRNSSLKSENIPPFIRLILLFVNLLMSYEVMTIDTRIRKVFLSKLDSEIEGFGEENLYDQLVGWANEIGLPNDINRELSKYFDSILPKTAGGLWHEMMVYAFILRFDIGFIFPLLLHQKLLSLTGKLSPPDLIILHKKTKRYYGIEIGDLKERQSGGFMVPAGIPVVPLDTRNSRISDRCPTCKKWILMCPKVISEFSDPNFEINRVEIRCLYQCEELSLLSKLKGDCPFMKYYDGKYHHHYKCLSDSKRMELVRLILKKHNITWEQLYSMFKSFVDNLPSDPIKIRTKKINMLKTHYPWYNELNGLIENN